MTTKNAPSTPETTAAQLGDSSPTAEAAPAKAKKPTPTELKAELEDLRRVAAARMVRIRELEVTAQKARTLLKKEGFPGQTMNQDHFRMKTMIQDLRKLLEVEVEEVSSV